MRRAVLLAIPAVLGLAPSTATAVFEEKCAGEKVTISFRDRGVGDRITGTGHRDVIQGGPRPETIFGRGGEDIICGGDSRDHIYGGADRDELHGQDGNDLFAGPGLAMDLVVGGPGKQFEDAAEYGGSPVGVRLDMSNGLVLADGAAVRGGIQGIEAASGTDHADHLVGSRHAQVLYGEGGNDVIDGRGGGDNLLGGGGIDRLTYASAKAPLIALLDRETAKVRDQDLPDEVRSFEIVVGTRFSDRITGSDRDEQLVGRAGDDQIKGREGHDNLEGGPGDDVLFPGPGDDTADGGTNDPVRGAGAPGDLVSYEGEKPSRETKTAYHFEIYLGVPPLVANGVGEDFLFDIESARGPKDSHNYFQGSPGPNILIGGTRVDYMDGGDGNDLLYGLGGEDSLNGDAGDDYLAGGNPEGKFDTDGLDGGIGEDTCVGARADYYANCETTG